MTESDKQRLRILTQEVNERLTEIQEIAGRKKIKEAKFEFPRGYIRTTDKTRELLPIEKNIFDETKLRNICYSLQMADLLRWLAIRTDIGGTLLSQIIKETICIYGHAIDYILDATCRQLNLLAPEKTKQFRKRSSLLVADNVIDKKTKQDIDWIWNIRCREHPDRLEELETATYSRGDANRARKGFQDFCEQAGSSVLLSDFDDIDI